MVERRIDATLGRLRAHAAGRLSVAGALVRHDGGDAEYALNSSGVTPFAVAALVDPDGLRRWLMHEAEAALQRLPEPATDEVREARLLELRRRLAEAEKREASLCWSAHEAGLDPGWRPDLDPAAALGWTNDELPRSGGANLWRHAGRARARVGSPRPTPGTSSLEF